MTSLSLTPSDEQKPDLKLVQTLDLMCNVCGQGISGEHNYATQRDVLDVAIKINRNPTDEQIEQSRMGVCPLCGQQCLASRLEHLHRAGAD